MSLYQIIWALRQLGISKRKCTEFLGVKSISDATIETFLNGENLITEASLIKRIESPDPSKEWPQDPRRRRLSRNDPKKNRCASRPEPFRLEVLDGLM